MFSLPLSLSSPPPPLSSLPLPLSPPSPSFSSLSLFLLPSSCAACLLHIVQERPKGMFGKLHIHNKVKQVHRVVEVVPV